MDLWRKGLDKNDAGNNQIESTSKKWDRESFFRTAIHEGGSVMPKNYYIVLGIPVTSNQEDIKAAYRRLAKEFHPDRYGEGASPFQTIQEAYSVLGDPVRRRAYDERRQQQRLTSPHGVNVESMKREMWAEPMIPEQGPVDLGEASLTRSFERYGPSFDALFDRIFSNFDESRRSKAERPEPVTTVVTLTPDQAFRGGHVRIAVPARIRCPNCRGAGGVGYYECWRCGGAGILTGEYPVIVSYPPGITDSHIVQLSLNRLGIRNLYLNVRFRISDLI
jgi:DnaJ-class molecular chaperone